MQAVSEDNTMQKGKVVACSHVPNQRRSSHWEYCITPGDDEQIEEDQENLTPCLSAHGLQTQLHKVGGVDLLLGEAAPCICLLNLILISAIQGFIPCPASGRVSNQPIAPW